MRSYIGIRTESGCCVESPAGRTLDLYLNEKNHSPTGFEWGYQGSGPSQLAYAILRHHTGSARVAEKHYQEFKQEYVSVWREDGFSITRREINEFLWRVA